MRGAVWHRSFHLGFQLASVIIFVLYVANRGAGIAGIHPVNYDKRPSESNSPENRLQSEIDTRSSAWEGRIGETSRPARQLLEGDSEDLVTDNAQDGISKLHSQESKHRGGGLEPLDWSTEFNVSIPFEKVTKGSSCTDAWDHPGYSDSCEYVKATPECRSGTLIEYTQMFYCFFARTPVIAYAILILYLAALFYTLGHNAHHFFCVSMDKLSQYLGMSSTLAGVTLLPFGNGAPDVFASIAAFVGHSGQGQVGLNSVLGGAMFVSSVVVGSVSLAMIAAETDVELDRRDFLRDVGFFLITLATLTAILFDGKIYFWEAVAYLSIYAFYVSVVAAVEYLRWRPSRSNESSNEALRAPLLAGSESEIVADGKDVKMRNSTVTSSPVDASLLRRKLAPHDDVDPIDNPTAVSSADATSLARRRLAPNGDIQRQESLIPFLQLRDEQEVEELEWCSLRGLFSYLIEWPLTLPRRLTIPLIEDPPRWSKFYAVCSITLAPLLLAMLWDGKDGGPFGSALVEYSVGGVVGSVLGGLSMVFLRNDRPPRRCKELWAAAGFIMSMVWFYLIAVELVAVLVSLGALWEIDPAIFGLTVLAWGNSVGDLMSNLALVSHGDHRMQTSFSGCYAGPMFNTLIGLGVSFVAASWKTYPAPFAIPEDLSLFVTLAFLVVGLVWSLAMLLSHDMQPTKAFGVGQLILYTSFLFTRLVYALYIKSFLLTD